MRVVGKDMKGLYHTSGPPPPCSRVVARRDPAMQPLRPFKIDFAIVGAARSGTTALYQFLRAHPEIFLPTAKELAYFTGTRKSPRQRAVYDVYYSNVPDGRRVGLAEANMLLFPEVPGRMLEHNPGLRVIAVLREPVARAWSAYWFARTRGWETAPTFEAALEREARGGLTSRFDRINFTYLEHGAYVEPLERFASTLGRDHVHVLLNEDLDERPESTLHDTLAWLGVDDPRLGGIDVHRRHNATRQVRSPRLGRWALRASALPRALIRLLVPKPTRDRLRPRIMRPLRELNRGPFTPPPMHPSTRARLRQHFEPEIRRLEAWLGRDLSSWRKG